MSLFMIGVFQMGSLCLITNSLPLLFQDKCRSFRACLAFGIVPNAWRHTIVFSQENSYFEPNSLSYKVSLFVHFEVFLIVELVSKEVELCNLFDNSRSLVLYSLQFIQKTCSYISRNTPIYYWCKFILSTGRRKTEILNADYLFI